MDTANLPALAQAARDAEHQLRGVERLASQGQFADPDAWLGRARQVYRDALRRVQLAAEAALAALAALPERAAGPAVESRGPGV